MAGSAQADVRIHLLGNFEVRADEAVIIDSSWPRRKAQALLKLLALDKGRWLHREQVLDCLWPGLEPAAAAANLRKNIHYLRSAFAEKDLIAPVVSAAADLLAISPDARIDYEEFRSRAHAARVVRTAATSYEQALALYGGDLLPDERYEEWTEPLRQELKALHNELLVELSCLYEVQGDTELAIEGSEQLLKADPVNEEGHRTLMRLYAQAGNREKALRQYHRGREREMEDLRQRVEDAVSGRGRLVMLAGEPGIGKTRTAEELATYARLRGARVLWGRCFEGEGAPAYWPWVQIIRTYVA